jgi:hypothetical protein
MSTHGFDLPPAGECNAREPSANGVYCSILEKCPTVRVSNLVPVTSFSMRPTLIDVSKEKRKKQNLYNNGVPAQSKHAYIGPGFDLGKAVGISHAPMSDPNRVAPEPTIDLNGRSHKMSTVSCMLNMLAFIKGNGGPIQKTAPLSGKFVTSCAEHCDTHGKVSSGHENLRKNGNDEVVQVKKERLRPLVLTTVYAQVLKDVIRTVNITAALAKNESIKTVAMADVYDRVGLKYRDAKARKIMCASLIFQLMGNHWKYFMHEANGTLGLVGTSVIQLTLDQLEKHRTLLSQTDPELRDRMFPNDNVNDVLPKFEGATQNQPETNLLWHGTDIAQNDIRRDHLSKCRDWMTILYSRGGIVEMHPKTEALVINDIMAMLFPLVQLPDKDMTVKMVNDMLASGMHDTGGVNQILNRRKFSYFIDRHVHQWQEIKRISDSFASAVVLWEQQTGLKGWTQLDFRFLNRVRIFILFGDDMTFASLGPGMDAQYYVNWNTINTTTRFTVERNNVNLLATLNTNRGTKYYGTTQDDRGNETGCVLCQENWSMSPEGNIHILRGTGNSKPGRHMLMPLRPDSKAVLASKYDKIGAAPISTRILDAMADTYFEGQLLTPSEITIHNSTKEWNRSDLDPAQLEIKVPFKVSYDQALCDFNPARSRAHCSLNDMCVRSDMFSGMKKSRRTDPNFLDDAVGRFIRARGVTAR